MVVNMGEYKQNVFKIIDVLLTKKNNQSLQDSIFIIMLRNHVRKRFKPANDLILFFFFKVKTSVVTEKRAKRRAFNH